MTPYVDFSRSFRPNLVPQSLMLTVPRWIVSGLARESKRLGVSEGDLATRWMGEKIERARKRLAKRPSKK